MGDKQNTMKFDQLKAKSNLKVLYRGQSSSGKTYGVSTIALEVARKGAKVLFIDNESEGAASMVSLIEKGEYGEEDVENITYKQVGESEEGENDLDVLMQLLSRDNQEKYDLVIVDPLDHKHTYALEKVTGSQMASDAEWNQYPAIYSYEKQLMELISKPRTNMLCTLDPKSGKVDKPKGAQSNIKGYFNVVLDLTREDDEWGNIIRNFVGRGEIIGKQLSNIHQNISSKLVDHMEVSEEDG